MLSIKFQVNWPLGSGEQVKNRFSRWRPWQPSWISDSIFKMAAMAAILDFRFERFYLFLIYTPMLPIKFQVNWPLGSGEEAKNRFSRWLPWWPSWISVRNHFRYF